MNKLSTCDHCQRPQRELITHLIPVTLRHDHLGHDLGEAFSVVRICRACGAQRQEDLRDFFAGHPPTALVCERASR